MVIFKIHYCKIKIISLYLIILSFLFFIFSCATQGALNRDFDFKLNLIPGKIYDIHSSVSQVVEYQVKGSTVKTTMQIDMSYQFRVQKGNVEQGYTLALTHKGYNIKFDDPQGAAQDRYSLQVLDWGKAFNAIARKEFFVEITARGEVVSISGLEEILKMLCEELAAQGDFSAEDILQQVISLFGEDYLSNTWDLWFTYIPKEKVVLGDTWSSSYTLSQGFPLKTDTYYTLEAVEEDFLIIKVSSKVESTGRVALPDSTSLTEIISLKGQQYGNIKVSRSSNWIQSLNLIQSMEGEIRFTGVDPGGQELKVPLEVESKYLFDSTLTE